MPCGCATALVPCEVPRLVTVSSYSESHEISFETQVYEGDSLSLVPVVLATAVLATALSRHFRPQPLCVLNLSGRDASARGSRTERAPAGASRRPFRLVLSARERRALIRLRDAARIAFRRASAPPRPPLPVRLAEAPRLVHS